jgi:hypothetical protein
VKEATFLMAVQRVIGGVEIEDDLLGRRRVRFEEQVDEQAFDRRAVVADLVVARRLGGRVLETVQGALAGERRAVRAPGGELAGERRQNRIVAQLIVVVQILIAERDAEHPLRRHRLDAVLDLRLVAAILEAAGEAPDQPDRSVGGAEQQRAGIGGDLAAVERSHHLAPFDDFITKQVAATLCRHRGAPLHRVKSLSQKNYRRFRAPMHLLAVRNPG